MKIMRVNKRILSIIMMSLQVFSTISIFWVPLFQVNAQATGSLTGTIYDIGVDTDSDGTFDYLEVGVEINVSTAGTFQVEASGLYDSTYNYISVWGQNFTYLDVGIQVVYLSLDGPTIYASGFNPISVSSIDFYDEYYGWLDSLYDTPLSRLYNYTEFDLPPAFLTGTIYDIGVDTDSDMTFDYLEVGVEINVSTAGTFQVEASGLYDSTYNYISVWGQNFTYLDVGIQVVYLSLDGPTIYASGFNPISVSGINLYDEYYNRLGSLFDVSLSREYVYTEFDLPPAFLTGTIYDIGVDTDSDGTFDYLEVAVKVNVTDSGDYRVEIRGLLDSGHNYISVSGYESEYLDAGIQVVNVSLRGPTIYFSRSNPVNVSEIALYSVEYVPPFEYTDWLGSVHNVPLSREYLYTEFDSPFNDMEAIFVVYPNGRVIMGGTLNYTDMEPPSQYPSMHGVATVQKGDTMTDVSASFTIIPPPDEASQFPFNSSAFELLSEYSDGLLSTTITGSTIFPPGIASEFPLNITDFTVKGEYADNVVNGNITVDIWNGFPLDDVVIYFDGNNTIVHMNGSTTVVFGNYPDFGEINATILERMLANLTDTYEGQGPGSLYNMTNGILEFTMLNNETTLHTSNATVDFEAKIEGDLIHALVNMTGQPAFLYDLLNTTWPSIESGSLLLTYAHAFKQADMEFDFTANVTHIFENLIPFLPDLMPPDEASFVESLLNTTYCTVNSAKVSLSYNDKQANLKANVTIQDFDAELNYIKTLLLIYNFSQPLSSQFQTINETQIDLTNFGMSVNIAETSMELDIQGFEVVPPLDWINSTNFKLERFFNLTAMDDYEPPIGGEKLKVTVEGRSNATHTVTISLQGTVPDPDMSSPGGMMWENQSISELKDLVFQIGPLDDTAPVIDVPIRTPEIPDDGEAVTISVNVTDADTGIPPYGVILSYRTNTGVWINITMSKMIGNLYEGEIPGLPGGTYVEYLIIAHDYANNEAIEDRSGAYYVYTVIPEFPTVQVLLIALLLIGVIIVAAKRKSSLVGYSLSQLSQKVRMLFPF